MNDQTTKPRFQAFQRDLATAKRGIWRTEFIVRDQIRDCTVAKFCTIDLAKQAADRLNEEAKDRRLMGKDY